MRRFYLGRIIFVSAIVVIAAVGIGDWFRFDVYWLWKGFLLFVILFGLGICGATFRQLPQLKNISHTVCIISLYALLFCCGLLRSQYAFHTNQFQSFVNQKVIIHATVISDPLYSNKYTQFVIQPDQPFDQYIKVSLYGKRRIHYKDYVYVVGKIQKVQPFGDFDYDVFQKTKGVYAEIKSPEIYVLHNKASRFDLTNSALRLKHEIIKRVNKYLPSEQAGLLISLVTGDKHYLSDYTIAAFNASGASHMIAVSGFNLTMMLVLLDGLLPYVGRRAALILSCIAAFFCTAVAGFGLSMIRACLMSGFVVLARVSGGKYNAIRGVVFSALILVLFRPLILRHDLSFILSCAGVLGLLLFNPVLKRILWFIPSLFGVREALLSTLSATILTAPIIALTFGRFSFVAPLTNIFILPLLTGVIILGYFCAVSGVGLILGKVMVYPLGYILAIVQGFGSLPYASIQWQISSKACLVIYTMLVLLYSVGYLVYKKRLKTLGSSGSM